MTKDQRLTIKPDCRHFQGHIPCKPHKQHGVHCADCQFYDPVNERFLIIKLGALGDVIRTTPLLKKIKSLHPHAEIWWLTLDPDILPDAVDRKLKFGPAAILQIEETEFDYLFCLDKDYEAAALANRTKARVKRGFLLKSGKTVPADDLAYKKFMTGLFDDVNKANKQSYLEELFEICGFTFGGERYELPRFESEAQSWNLDSPKQIIGLNTGCGGRWTSRLWGEDRWAEVAKGLISRGHRVILLGGEQEDARNKRIAASSGAEYLGFFPLKKFINLMDQVDLVVTGVTMGFHIALGLGKKVVLINNIFNRNEFELYGLGKIVEPDKECTCYFMPKCVNKEYFCLNHLPSEKVLSAVLEVLGLPVAAASAK